MKTALLSVGLASVLVACSSNVVDLSVPATKTIASVAGKGTQRPAISKGAQTLYVLEMTSSFDFSVSVFADAGARYLHKIDLGVPTLESVAFAVDKSNRLYASSADDGKPASLGIYVNNGGRLLRTLKQGHPFIGLTVDSNNNLFASCTLTATCERANGKSRVTRKLRQGAGIVAVDTAGNVAAALGQNLISVWAPGQTEPYWTIAGSFPYINDLVFDSAGNLYVSLRGDHDSGKVLMYAPNGTTPIKTITNGIDFPTNIVEDASDNLFVMNRTNITVYPVGSTTPSRTITDGVLGGYQVFSAGSQMAFDRTGNLYVANWKGGITVYAPGGTSPIRTFTNKMDGAYAIAFSP